MPLVALDAKFSGGLAVAAFVIPFAVNLFARDVLEPTLIGQSTSLHPVIVLLAILLYGSVWGITGMVMAIPLTAVLRIVLSSIEHPLPLHIAAFLAGEAYDPKDAAASAATEAWADALESEGLMAEEHADASGGERPPPKRVSHSNARGVMMV